MTKRPLSSQTTDCWIPWSSFPFLLRKTLIWFSEHVWDPQHHCTSAHSNCSLTPFDRNLYVVTPFRTCHSNVFYFWRFSNWFWLNLFSVNYCVCVISRLLNLYLIFNFLLDLAETCSYHEICIMIVLLYDWSYSIKLSWGNCCFQLLLKLKCSNWDQMHQFIIWLTFLEFFCLLFGETEFIFP